MKLFLSSSSKNKLLYRNAKLEEYSHLGDSAIGLYTEYVKSQSPTFLSQLEYFKQKGDFLKAHEIIYLNAPFICSNKTCVEEAVEGAHIKRADVESEIFVVPLCKSCNRQKDENYTFALRTRVPLMLANTYNIEATNKAYVKLYFYHQKGPIEIEILLKVVA